MEFIELARKRFSVLEYDERPVEEEKITAILEAGLAAPTACNYQPQRLLVIRSDEDREKLNRIVPNKRFFPVAFLVCYDKDECWKRPFDGKESGDIDASIVATHMMMEATDMGLGSIWVMHWDPVRMKEEFGLAESVEPVALLIVGYASGTATPRSGHFASKQLSETII